MAVSSPLFDLIKSLDSSEKGYFKKFAYKGEAAKDSAYLKLFDSIDKQSDYDEPKLIKKFSGAKMPAFSVLKNHLYNLLLNSLKEFQRKHSIHAQIHSWLEEIDVLYKKRLYNQAEKVRKKAFKLAVLHEKFHLVVELYRWEEELLHMTDDLAGIQRFLDSGFKKEYENFEAMKNYRESRELCIRFFKLIREDMSIRSEDRKKEMAAIMKHPLLTDENNSLSVKAKSQFFYVMAKHSRMAGDMEQSYIFRKKHVALVEANPQFITESRMTYLRTLNNLLVAQYSLGKFEEMENTLDKVRRLQDGATLNEKLEALDIEFKISMGHYLDTFDFSGKEANIAAIESQFNNYRAEIPAADIVLGDYYFMLYHYYRGDLPASQDYVNRLMTHPPVKLMENIFSATRMLYLIIHYELGNHEHYEHALVSTYRYFYRKPEPFKAELLILKYLKKLALAADEPKRISIFEKLLSDLLPLKDDEYESAAFTYFDLTGWLEGKIKGKQMVEVMREKRAYPIT